MCSSQVRGAEIVEKRRDEGVVCRSRDQVDVACVRDSGVWPRVFVVDDFEKGASTLRCDMKEGRCVRD